MLETFLRPADEFTIDCNEYYIKIRNVFDANQRRRVREFFKRVQKFLAEAEVV